MTADRSGRLLSLQYLRAVAALGVVAFHTTWTHTIIGAAGVDLFFVISGFVMVHVSVRENRPFLFLRRRLIRLVPLYWLLTLLAALLSQASPRNTILSLLFWPHADGAGGENPIIWQGWSLEYEMFFYVLFAAALSLPSRLRFPSLSLALLASVLFGLLFDPHSPPLRAYTNLRLLEFLAGIWICLAARRGFPRPIPAALLLAAGIVLFALQAVHPIPELDQGIAWGLPSAFIVAGAIGMERAGWVPSVPSLKLLGDASYSIYLSQAFVLALVLAPLRPLPAILAVPAACAACALAGVALYLAIERPIHRVLTSGAGRRPQPALPVKL
jgi:exopolysaccharide production protein ExoZ